MLHFFSSTIQVLLLCLLHLVTSALSYFPAFVLLFSLLLFHAFFSSLLPWTFRTALFLQEVSKYRHAIWELSRYSLSQILEFWCFLTWEWLLAAQLFVWLVFSHLCYWIKSLHNLISNLSHPQKDSVGQVADRRCSLAFHMDTKLEAIHKAMELLSRTWKASKCLWAQILPA